jgi:hypothetical protein
MEFLIDLKGLLFVLSPYILGFAGLVLLLWIASRFFKK